MIRAGGVVLVDDSYNAAPGSMLAALELLAGLPADRRIAVLGEMRELGDAHDAAHLTIGAAAGRVLDALVVVDGQPRGRARGIVDGALATGMPAGSVLAVEDAVDAVPAALAIVRPGDAVLVKASRGVELERVVDGLVAALGRPEPAP